MFILIDFLEDEECQYIFNIVLVEGNIFLSIFMDKFFEELVYLGIFFG